jgi:fimbrial chaperone protein
MISAGARRLSLAGLCLAASWLPDGAAAGQLKVSPIRLDLSAEQPLGVVTIGNPGDTPVLLHLRLREWHHRGGWDVYSDSRELLLNPMIFKLEPQQEQLVRVGLVRPLGSDQERAYRLFIQEVPDGRPQIKRRISTYLNISLPLFVAPDADGRDRPDRSILVWKLEPAPDGGLVLQVENKGNLHAEVAALDLRRQNGAPVTTIDRRSYVLAGERRQWAVPGDAVGSGEILTLTAESDSGPVRMALRPGKAGPVEEARQ